MPVQWTSLNPEILMGSMVSLLNSQKKLDASSNYIEMVQKFMARVCLGKVLLEYLILIVCLGWNHYSVSEEAVLGPERWSLSEDRPEPRPSYHPRYRWRVNWWVLWLCH